MVHPGYEGGRLVRAVWNMAAPGTTLLGLGLLAAWGVFLVAGEPVYGVACGVFGGMLVAGQVKSRLGVLRSLRRLRRSGDAESGFAYRDASGVWRPLCTVASLRATHPAYADPWRPFTIGFPAIEIGVVGEEGPVEDVFGYFMEAERDLVLAELGDRFGVVPTRET